MKKIISLIVFAAALIWTWNIVHSSSAVGFETHSGIQQKLAELIQQTIQKKKPEARDFQIVRLWTESVNENKVRAVFAYRFNEGTAATDATEQTIEGEAILHREIANDQNVDRWTLVSVKTLHDTVIFEDGSLINPATPDETTEEGAAPADASKTEGGVAHPAASPQTPAGH